jgi:GT2 family glycosyltransferase
MHVAVCLVGFRNSGDIAACLAALERSTYADFDVIICENGGAEAFQALQRVAPSRLFGGQPVRAVQASRNVGYAGGVNIGIRETSSADAWWILNPDTQPDPDAMALQVARLSVGDCEAVGSTIYLPDGTVQSHGGRWRPWLARAESIGHGSSLSVSPDPQVIERDQNYLNGASMMISRRFLEIVGPMREEYFLYCEEVEWCLRGQQLGMRLGFAPGAFVLHHAGTTTGSYADIRKRPKTPIYLNERNKMLTTRDMFPGRFGVAAPSALALMLLRFGRRGAWRQVTYGLSGWMAGLFNRRGAPAWLKT